MPEIRVAPPLTRDEIEDLAWEARHTLGLRPFDKVPMARILQHSLPELIPDYEFRVIENAELGGAEAVTDAIRPIITFGASANAGLERDHHRARMTGAHELGHLLLHTGQTAYAFLRKKDHRIDPEKQADIFAEAFLMPECAFRRMRSIREAMKTFGVSRDAAHYRARKLRMWGLVDKCHSTKPAKRKGYSKRHTPK